METDVIGYVQYYYKQSPTSNKIRIFDYMNSVEETMEHLADLNQLYLSYRKTRLSAPWKESTQRYSMNFLKNIVRARDELLAGTYEVYVRAVGDNISTLTSPDSNKITVTKLASITAESVRISADKKSYEWDPISGAQKYKVTVNGDVILDGNIRKACKGNNVSKDGSKTNPYTVDKKNHPGLFNKSGHIGFLGHGEGLKLRNVRIKDLSK
mgnify:CR=1 FL=1